MREIGSYLIHITSAALVCGVVIRLLRGGQMISMIGKLLCGLFLAYTIIKPIPELQSLKLREFSDNFNREAMKAVEWGASRTREVLSESIISKTQAYIMEKAKAMDVDLAVEVELSDDDVPIPVSVSLTGNIAPYAKTVLSEQISNELNIPKEKQKWILP